MKTTAEAPVRIDFAGAWTDVPMFYETFGGATLNAAIRKYVRGELLSGDHRKTKDGMTVHYEADLPWGAGLGSSAAMNVLWLGLIKGRPLASVQERLDLAENAFKIEKVLGIIGGKQDQCGSAVGGINVFEFTRDGIRSLPVGLSASRVRELESCLLLCYTRTARLSSRIHENVWGNFAKGHLDIIDALIRMRDSAYEGKEALEKGDFEKFGKILTMQFECTKIMDSSTSNQMLEDLFALVKGDILGGKPCGAGGGGCVVFCCDGEQGKRRATEKITNAGYSVLDLAFDFQGLKVSMES
jgi:D-glycero-alpha-D-manno-heptose-7-phosphate kinase